MIVNKSKPFDFLEGEFLWRFMDLHKFFSFVLEKKLFFARLDSFDDPLEGLTELLIGHIAASEYEKDGMFDIPDESKEDYNKKREARKKIIEEGTRQIQTTLFANCWFIGKKESFAMWNMYSDQNSVAIRYNPDQLLKLVIPLAESYTNEDFKAFLYGKVEYYDVWPFSFTKKNDADNKYTPYKKDKSYIHENEFRFTVAVPHELAGKYEYFKLPFGDIAEDDFKIFANPKMEDWKFNNLKKLLEPYKLSDKLVKSVLKTKN